MGATFRVEGSGSLVFGGTFRNVGGTADLTGGGQLAINGTLAGFEHGASPGPTTVRSTVVGGAVRMTVGTLRPTEGGPGAFRWGPDDLAVLDGTLRADQSIEAHCADNSYSYLRLAAGARNEGTIRLLPAARGTTCLTYFYPLAEFTNAGALVFGDGSVTGAAFQIGNAGRVLNEAAGSIEVDGTVANFVPITNDGTVTVRPGGRIDNYNRTFDHRNGVIANAGTFAMGSVGPPFRSQAGAVTGNPVTLLAGRLELVGAGAASFLVPASNGATLADGSGRALIRPPAPPHRGGPPRHRGARREPGRGHADGRRLRQRHLRHFRRQRHPKRRDLATRSTHVFSWPGAPNPTQGALGNGRPTVQPTPRPRAHTTARAGALVFKVRGRNRN